MEKVCIKNMGVQHSFEKMKPQLCFFKKPSLVVRCSFIVALACWIPLIACNMFNGLLLVFSILHVLLKCVTNADTI